MAAPSVTELTNWAVDLVGVTKTYRGKIQALRGVNLQVGRGEIFGLLGPNGAGKSTLVKIMMTVVRPDQAMGTLQGRPLGNQAKLARTGYLPENLQFPKYLTARQAMEFYARLAKVPADLRRQRIPALLERVGLKSWADARVSKFSKGMLQRLGIAQALTNDPDLIVLDEPTDGIDPVGRREVRELLVELRRQRKTIFLNSHLLSELEMVCDRVAILVDGLVVRQGTLAELTARTMEYQIAAAGDLELLRARLAEEGARISDHKVIIPHDDKARLNRVIDILRTGQCLIHSVEPVHLSLEDVFMDALARRADRPVGPTARPAGGAR